MCTWIKCYQTEISHCEISYWICRVMCEVWGYNYTTVIHSFWVVIHTPNVCCYIENELNWSEQAIPICFVRSVLTMIVSRLWNQHIICKYLNWSNVEPVSRNYHFCSTYGCHFLITAPSSAMSLDPQSWKRKTPHKKLQFWNIKSAPCYPTVRLSTIHYWLIVKHQSCPQTLLAVE